MLSNVIFNNVLGILLVLVVFGLIVFIHELGHFLMAKLFGIKVEEFGLGLPPRMAKVYEDMSGTVYSINALPIGGFVSLKGEKYDELSVFEKDSLAGANIFKQMIIVLAGVGMNFLLAGIIFSMLFYTGIQPFAINTKFDLKTKTKLIVNLDDAISEGLLNVSGLVLSPIKGSIAEQDGLRDKDILTHINGKKVTKPEEMINAVKYFESPIVFTVVRDNKENNIQIMPVDGKIGCFVDYNFINKNKTFRYKYPFGEAVKEGFWEGINQLKLILEGLKMVAVKTISPRTSAERKEALESIGGPISLGSLFIDLVNSNANVVVYFVLAALLSLNLTIFNLLPIPALDGGRFFIMLINGFVIFIFGKKAIDEKTETLIHIVGFGLLIGLSIVVAYMDLFRIFSK